jgi:DNA-binding CsgD family transcriptional regulator
MALLFGSRAALSGSGSLADAEPGAGTATAKRRDATAAHEAALAAREIAARRLGRAARIADDLGARPLAAQIADLARRAGLTLPAPDGEASPDGDAGAPARRLGLTAREFEVLRLLAEGQSNREIAAALFISPKTASVHVSNILGKLGTATRTEAAAKAHALHLFG